MKMQASIGSILVLASLWMGSASASFAQNQTRNYEIDDLITTQRLSDRAIVVRSGVSFYDAVTAIATEKGIVVIDAGTSPQLTEKYRRIIEKELGRRDFIYVIHTHSHCDHIWGNQAFPQAQIIGHATCREAMILHNKNVDYYPRLFNANIGDSAERRRALDANSDAGKQAFCDITRWSMGQKDLECRRLPALPAITFTDKLTLSLGDRTFELIYFGNAHSESDILVYVPEEKLLFSGDVFFKDRDPDLRFFFSRGNHERQDVGRWHDALGYLLAPEREITNIVHGHGWLMSKSDLGTAHRSIIALWEGFRAGKELYPAGSMKEIIEKSGVEAAAAEFRKLRSAGKSNYFFVESGFKDLAYGLLYQGKTKAAIGLFRMNVELFPRSWDAYDSLGEAYRKDGNIRLAIESYEMSLQLNPDNRSGAEALKELRQMM